jgi:fatty acid desaturase
MDDARAWLGVLSAVGAVVVIVSAAMIWWSPWAALLAMVLLATRQQAFFVLAHDAAHYRLFSNRRLNDVVGRAFASTVGISMCSYRVIHRLHHNDLFGETDPDTPLHGGYPRGRMYLVKRLGRDLAGLTAYKTYSYFFGAPALNVDSEAPRRPLDDTAPGLRLAAQADRRGVIITQLVMLSIAVLSGYGIEYVLLWIVPALTFLQALLRIRALMEHGALLDVSSPLTAARTNLGQRWLMWLVFPHHVNYHIEHHLYPAIPHYNLPAAHAALRDLGVLSEAEVSNIPRSLRAVFAPRRVSVAA